MLVWSCRKTDKICHTANKDETELLKLQGFACWSVEINNTSGLFTVKLIDDVVIVKFEETPSYVLTWKIEGDQVDFFMGENLVDLKQLNELGDELEKIAKQILEENG